MSMLDFQVLEYRATGNMVAAGAMLREKMAEVGMREMMRRTGLSQHTLEKIFRCELVRRVTLQRALAAVSLTQEQWRDST